jgi:diguanylate cyclase (GGDEF)-like protein/PAS domain S-box-containing protein
MHRRLSSIVACAGAELDIRTAHLGSRWADPRLDIATVLDALPHALYLTDAAGEVIFCNRRTLALLEAAGGTTGAVAPIPRVLAEAVLDPADLAAVQHFAGSMPLIGCDGCLLGMVHEVDDPAPFRSAEATLIEMAQRYHYTVMLGDQIPWLADAAGAVYDVGDRWCALTGMSREAMLRSGMMGAVHAEDHARTAAVWALSLASGARLDHEYRLRMADGSYRWFRSRAAPFHGEDGRILRWYGTTEDIHDRRAAEIDLRWQASHDALTGLGNRIAFHAWLDQALAEAEAQGCFVGLLVLDVDHFKLINDHLGHDTGDALLAELGARLAGLVGDGETVARLGGDEFALIMPGHVAIADVAARAGAIADRLGGSFRHAGAHHDYRVSAGVAVYPVHGGGAEQIVKNADLALYEAKANGRARYCMFHGEMRAEQQRRSSMLAMARRAAQDDLIVPFYQPKHCLASGRVVGFEALLRWHHPRLGIQLPATIAAGFDDADTARLISDRMLTAIVADMAGWQAAGLDFGHVALNASPADLRRADYGEALLARLAAAGIPPERIEVEVTETVFLGRGAEIAEQILRRLSGAGVRIALDDFGTGYASLSHLQHFPVDVIKIDRSFVAPMKVPGAAAPIAHAVIALARGFRMTSVAEGIETAEQAAQLREAGCDLGQGFHFAAARPAADVPAMLAARWSGDEAG